MFFYRSIVFYICSKGPSNRDISYHLWTALSFPDKSKSVGFKSFKSLLIHITCLQSFLQGYFTIVWLFFCWGSVQFRFILTNISSNMLRNFLHCFLKVAMYNWLGMSIIFTHSLQEYSAFLQHWHSKRATCFIMASLTFLPTSASDSSLLNLAFEFLISSVNLDVAVYC